MATRNDKREFVVWSTIDVASVKIWIAASAQIGSVNGRWSLRFESDTCELYTLWT